MERRFSLQINLTNPVFADKKIVAKLLEGIADDIRNGVRDEKENLFLSETINMNNVLDTDGNKIGSYILFGEFKKVVRKRTKR